ncbi:cbb3-type cytochrome oxidase assembly protein CcoS [bacterium]|nr:cbb3-type cytochrome oxidase assembly protein CcoS [bacterium]
MEILYLLIPLSILLGSVFLAAFILASKTQQFEDMETPAMRMLLDDDEDTEKKIEKEQEDDENREGNQP